MKRIKKSEIAFDLLTQEMERINLSEMHTIKGGDMIETNPYKAGNGYCYFNALAYVMINAGIKVTADHLLTPYCDSSGTFTYSGSGLNLGISSSNALAMDNYYMNALNATKKTYNSKSAMDVAKNAGADLIISINLGNGPSSHDTIYKGSGTDTFGDYILYQNPGSQNVIKMHLDNSNNINDIVNSAHSFNFPGSTGTTFTENLIDPNSLGSTGLFSVTQDNNGDWIQNFYYYDPTDPQYMFQWTGNQVPESSGYLGYSTGYKNMTTDTYFDVSTGDEEYYISTGNYSTGNESTGN